MSSSPASKCHFTLPSGKIFHPHLENGLGNRAFGTVLGYMDEDEGLKAGARASASNPPAEDSYVETDLHTASASDLPAVVDHLGFKPYISALERFLTNHDSRGPLTISIEGEWGSGKSSFMKQLGERLEKSASKPIVIQFNAWRHDRADELWAAFALEFVRQIRKKETRCWARWNADRKLFWLRFNWGSGWPDVGRILIWLSIVGAAISAGIYVYYGLGSLPKWVVPVATVIASLGSAVAWLAERVGNPLKIDLKRHTKSPDYKRKLSFIEQFHEDFAKILRAYARDRRVFVFVDDLDRCEIPKAAELMQALNLMLSGDNDVFFLLGMDRHKVAAGIAVKNSQLLPYLSAGEKAHADLKRYGLSFGYEFIEKFIQVPFVLPRPGEREVERYLRSLSGAGADEEPSPSPEAERRRETLRLTAASSDSPEILRVAKTVAAALDDNPRRIKVFLNLFRLRLLTAVETGLFDKDGGMDAFQRMRMGLGLDNWLPDQREITLYQLGTFVALSLRWPLFLTEAARDPQLISRLEKGENGPAPSATSQWLKDEVLLKLLRGPQEYRLGEVDIRRLLRVLPQRQLGPVVHEVKMTSSGQGSTSFSASVSSVTANAAAQAPSPELPEGDFPSWSSPPT